MRVVGHGVRHQILETDMSFLNDLKKRAAYARTVRELRNLPVDTALDLDIYPADAERLAHRAVYGR